jgi:hypothetical protein
VVIATSINSRYCTSAERTVILYLPCCVSISHFKDILSVLEDGLIALQFESIW